LRSVLVIGSGLTGLWTALSLAEHGLAVDLVTKQDLMESNTRYAQGGIAAAITPDDSPDLHFEDTMSAGAGLCDPEAVQVLTEEGPEQLRALIEAGVRFDREADGELAVTLEAAHSRRRVVHALGDATGLEIERALAEQALRHPAITLHEQCLALDLVVDGGGCRGADVMDAKGRVTRLAADATVLAAGGAGQVYRNTTNPPTATGDAAALAWRAGAELSDMEFMQFHPTAFTKRGVRTHLISEAVRGEGAILRNAEGEAFMERYDARKELAPRDVVARAIATEMAHDGRNFVWLDLRHLDPALVHARFPNIVTFCREHGVRLPEDMIPVAPAAHYFIGGVKTDLWGRTSVPSLYAAGEAAATGVHGANRLASNSLLEAVVFGHRVATAIARSEEHPSVMSTVPPAARPSGEGESPASVPEGPVAVEAWRAELQAEMWEHVGLVRQGAGLCSALERIAGWRAAVEAAVGGSIEPAKRDLHELRNLLTTAQLITEAALWRQESRGVHARTDYPEMDDSCRKHFIQARLSPSPASIR
jgi:L-aspartate oxidase